MTTPVEAVLVHVTNAHEMHPEARPEKPRDVEINTKTFNLKTSQTGDPVDSVVQRILDRDLSRVQAIISVASGTVFLSHSRTQAQAAAADASTPGGAMDGFLVVAGQALPPLTTTDPLWAVVPTDKASTGAQVSVISERRRS